MKKLYIFFVFALLTVGLSLGYASSAGGQNSFLIDAARGGIAEIEIAKLAMKKSGDPAVKAFAQRLMNDHSVSGRELSSLASKKEVTLPAEIGNRERAAIDKLNTLSGAAFDAEFIRQTIKDHEIAIALYRRASTINSDEDIKEYAAKHLPDLEAHLQTARSMNRAPATIKSNSNKSFKPTLGEVSANTNTIIITNASNMTGHPNLSNANAQPSFNSNVSGNVNR